MMKQSLFAFLLLISTLPTLSGADTLSSPLGQITLKLDHRVAKSIYARCVMTGDDTNYIDNCSKVIFYVRTPLSEYELIDQGTSISIPARDLEFDLCSDLVELIEPMTQKSIQHIKSVC